MSVAERNGVVTIADGQNFQFGSTNIHGVVNGICINNTNPSELCRARSRPATLSRKKQMAGHIVPGLQ
ncbi:hypothetical protein QO002_001654 [Pararhizobium capsulatum DSM 1112]|uniref:Uncharacterized protein n=1 Tax=Pararhizobium capsulatum DSM 1112 TaxID=1121113 RepID=A0ABU0BMM9_9HYPH|nr:hypothetical protein [Pararhizobium capsulatum]MDQ0319516.1 hypothetical protein [Pararhizobium capsulatum DSM 1112]